jgi:glyoxylase I family protein
MQPVGIQHVTLGVHDLDAAIEFLAHLGMTVCPNRPDFGFPGAWMQVADHQVHLVVTPDRPAPDASTHFALIVDDLDACLAELDEAGIAYRRARVVPGAGRQAFLEDPSGNVIELNQPERPWAIVRSA